MKPNVGANGYTFIYLDFYFFFNYTQFKPSSSVEATLISISHPSQFLLQIVYVVHRSVMEFLIPNYCGLRQKALTAGLCDAQI
jgi:hypothetical protein